MFEMDSDANPIVVICWGVGLLLVAGTFIYGAIKNGEL